MPSITIRIGERRKIFGGWERRDRVILNGKELAGYIRRGKAKGETIESTHYNGEFVPGYDWYWLAKKNCRTVKAPEGYTQPIPQKMAA